MTAGLEHDPITALGHSRRAAGFHLEQQPRQRRRAGCSVTDGAVRCERPADARNSSSLAGVSIRTTCAGDIADAERLAQRDRSI
jgi:hypothetical protein